MEFESTIKPELKCIIKKKKYGHQSWFMQFLKMVCLKWLVQKHVKIPLPYREYKNQQGKLIHQHEPKHHQQNL